MLFIPKMKNGNFGITFQNPKFHLKNRTICCRTKPGHLACRILGWYIYFRQTCSPKTVSVDDVIFSTLILSISRHRKEIKMTFFRILRPNWFTNTRFSYSKISIRKFDFLTCLTWPFPVVDLRGVRFQNGFDSWILRSRTTSHVPHARKKLILVTFRDLLDLTLTLTRT